MTVSHWFLFQTLERMGVPLTFISWIRTLYTDMSSEVQVNRFLSTQITVESGVWQRCPLSPILLVCTIKPLTQHLSQDPGIHGVHILGSSNQDCKLLAYMENLNILCQNKWSVETALWNTQVNEAGAKLNVSKSTCLAMGNLRNLESLGVSVPCEGVKILRIEFDPKLSSRPMFEKTKAKTLLVQESHEAPIHPSPQALLLQLFLKELQKLWQFCCILFASHFAIFSGAINSWIPSPCSFPLKCQWYASGADECCTREDNILAYKRIRFRPRMLRDMSVIDTKTTLLGTEISFPVGIAPTGFHQLAWPDGEKSTARAAAAMNTCYITSTYSTCAVEEIAAAAPRGFRWFQLYIHRNRALTAQLVQRVEALGFQGLVLTADLPYTGKRRADIHNNFQENICTEYGLPPNFIDPSINWNDIYWLKSLTRLPIIVKGILTREDADLAARHGVQGIIVSNHGGRQLDGGPATIDALVEVVDMVQDKMEVYLDGGIRTGSDVLKALALGAKCVFIGRPVLWGLTYKGEEGLREVLQILHDELRLSMALAGCHNVTEIGRHLVQFSKL
ncbi:hydroxyacid oxidase 2 isoform A [Alligator mississippiensis]|uniref:Hydroxyacid oxidase 2 isoform A n=1 Tax=Alligator mississippiensis TaxID=8496 RepID=A0A151M1P6_ALLMI|nr:hydroxyacid oxidase 2 isoform A [Alligator mississippiensis]